MTENTCQKCNFYEILTDSADGWGRCHRYAPKPSTADSVFEWPAVIGRDWCGEYKDANTKDGGKKE